ncbi:MAG TPA: PTS system mannose/fructose/sorbose family transporter subunit IID [Longilinea sp.]|nr:PTS system mannose/fructose/sorbose family transporter subunit IID [Longilinea sp.]
MTTIPIGVAFLLAFCAGFAYFGRRFLGDWYLERAIILGPLTGLILGDLQKGLLIGGTLELIFMGASDIGGTVPPNLPVGSILGTAFAITENLTVQQSLVIAIPAALIGSFFELLAKTVSTIFVSGAERFADDGNTMGISVMVHLGNFVHFLADFIPTFVGLSLGGAAVSAMATGMPQWLQDGVNEAGNVLPALGFGLLLSTLATPGLLPWFFLGFVLAAYLKMGVLGAAFVGVMVAIIFVIQKGGIQILSPAGEAEKEEASLVSKKDQTQIWIRSFALQSAFSFDRMQALGFTWGLIPFLKKVYADNTAELKKALRRHLTFINTHMWISGPIYASVAELEARKSQHPDEVDEQSIQAVKGSLMGPLAGIGDSMFHGTLRPLMGGVAASLALQGNPIAPLLFFFGTNIVHVYVSWASNFYSFRFGGNLFERIDQDGLHRLMEGAAIAGLMGIGGLVGTWLSVTTPLTYVYDKFTFPIQSMFDSIMPKLLPLLLTLGVYWAVRRGVKTLTIMLVLAVGGIVLGALKILGG